jgi:hypothetical protein
MSVEIYETKRFNDTNNADFPIREIEAKAAWSRKYKLKIYFPPNKKDQMMSLLITQNIRTQYLTDHSLVVTSNGSDYSPLNEALVLLQNDRLIRPNFAQEIIQNFPNGVGQAINLSQPARTTEQIMEDFANRVNSMQVRSASRRVHWFNESTGFGFIEPSGRMSQNAINTLQDMRVPEEDTPLNDEAQEINERQVLLDSLRVEEIDINDEAYELIQKLYDPITLAAICHPCKLRGDTTNQYFEFHSLMALNRDREGHFAHPLTREKFKEENIVHCTEEYSALFDRVVQDINDRKSGLSI